MAESKNPDYWEAHRKGREKEFEEQFIPPGESSDLLTDSIRRSAQKAGEDSEDVQGLDQIDQMTRRAISQNYRARRESEREE